MRKTTYILKSPFRLELFKDLEKKIWEIKKIHLLLY
jgi:hypothetical protein